MASHTLVTLVNPLQGPYNIMAKPNPYASEKRNGKTQYYRRNTIANHPLKALQTCQAYTLARPTQTLNPKPCTLSPNPKPRTRKALCPNEPYTRRAPCGVAGLAAGRAFLRSARPSETHPRVILGFEVWGLGFRV